jgi:predicted aspartyl protease
MKLRRPLWIGPAVGLIAFLLCGAAGAQQASCPLHAMARLEMQTMPDGRVTIPVQVEGHDYRLMVDTGGYINTLSPQLVKEQGYEPQRSPGELRGMGTTRLDHYVTVKDFVIAHSRGKNFKFYVDDFSDAFEDGTLAPQVLAAYDVDLDFGHGKLNLISPDHCPGQVAYWTKNAVAVVPIEIQDLTHIRIPVTIDGKEMKAVVDTGASTSFITMRAARRYLDIDEKDPALKLRGNIPVNGMMGPVYNYPFHSLSFGGVTVNNPRIQMVADKVWDQTDLLLGIGILRQLHIYIAYKERKMYITPALTD